MLVTLSITYLVSVASAVALRRQLDSYIASLGDTPHVIVINGWNGTSFSALGQHLVALAPLIHTARQQHLAYPVLHSFHSQHPESAAAPNLVNLSQALDLMCHGVAPGARPDSAIVDPVHRAIGSLTMPRLIPSRCERPDDCPVGRAHASGRPTRGAAGVAVTREPLRRHARAWSSPPRMLGRATAARRRTWHRRTPSRCGAPRLWTTHHWVGIVVEPGDKEEPMALSASVPPTELPPDPFPGDPFPGAPAPPKEPSPSTDPPPPPLTPAPVEPPPAGDPPPPTVVPPSRPEPEPV